MHPDRRFCIGHDCGIYWRSTKEPLDGCKAPDWFYVPGVMPMIDGHFRRSYVMWQESIRPQVIVEYVSGDGSEERDNTPFTGKFWVYEKAIGAGYYAIYEVEKGTVELFKLNVGGGPYQRVEPNSAGRYPIEPLGVELGIWQGNYRDMELPWLRAWDAAAGKMLPTEEEHAAAETQRADTAEVMLDDSRQLVNEETKRAEDERQRADGALARADDERQRADDERQRADDERKKAEDMRQRAETEWERAEKLAERLRAAGIDPDAP